MASLQSVRVLVALLGIFVGAAPAGTQLRALQIEGQDPKPVNGTSAHHGKVLVEPHQHDAGVVHHAGAVIVQSGSSSRKSLLQIGQAAKGARHLGKRHHARHSKLSSLRHNRASKAGAGQHLRSHHGKKSKRHIVALELSSGSSAARRRRSRRVCTHVRQMHIHAFCDEEVGNWIDPDGHERRSLWCSGRPDRGKEDERCGNVADFRFCAQRLFSCYARKEDAKRCCIGTPVVDECGECQVAWQMRQEKKCHEKFGDRSTWDKGSPMCKSAWEKCTDGQDDSNWLECCTKPTGPKNLEDFCRLKHLQNPDHVDAACQVDHHVRGIKALANEFVEVTSGVTKCNLPALPSQTATMPPLAPPPAKACVAPEPAPAVPCLMPPAPAPEPLVIVPVAPMPVPGPGPAAAAPAWAAPPPAPAPAPAVIEEALAVAGAGDEDVETTSGSPPTTTTNATTEAPTTTTSPPPPPMMKLSSDDQCARMDQLALSIQAQVVSLQKFDGSTPGEGVVKKTGDTFNQNSQENADPDLSNRVKQVLKVGEILRVRSAQFCQKHPPGSPSGGGSMAIADAPSTLSKGEEEEEDTDADADDDGDDDAEEDEADVDDGTASGDGDEASPPAAQPNSTSGAANAKAGAKAKTADADDSEEDSDDDPEEPADGSDADAQGEEDGSDGDGAAVKGSGGGDQAPAKAADSQANPSDDAEADDQEDEDDTAEDDDGDEADAAPAAAASSAKGDDSDAAPVAAAAPAKAKKAPAARAKAKKTKKAKRAVKKEAALDLNHTDVEDSLQAIFLMDEAINQVQTKVHPHSLKWWRWRYEYTVVEFFFLAPCLMILYYISEAFRWLDTKYLGKCSEVTIDTPIKHMTKFALISFFIRSVAVIQALFCLKVLRDYTTYEMDDGTSSNIFDWFALFVRRMLNADHMIDEGIGMNLPYLGESYYNQMCDVLMHIWGAVWIYTLLIILIIKHYIFTYETLKDFEKKTEQEDMTILEVSKDREDIGRSGRFRRAARNASQAAQSSGESLLERYQLLETYFLRKCISMAQSAQMDDDKTNDNQYALLAQNLKKLGISMDQNIEDGEREQFKFYRYIGITFLRSTQSLVRPGIGVLLPLVIGSISAAFVAYYWHIAFVFFLPWILLSVLLVFVGLHYYAKMLWKTTMTEVPLALDKVPQGFDALDGLFKPSGSLGSLTPRAGHSHPAHEKSCTIEYSNANGAVIYHHKCHEDGKLSWRMRISAAASVQDYVFYSKDSENSPTPPVGEWKQKGGDLSIQLEPKITSSHYVTTSIYAHGQLIQLVLIALSYSFSRLLYSSYIWRDYFYLFIFVLLGFILTFLCIYFFALKTQCHFVFALSLPPHRGCGHLNDDLYAILVHKTHHFHETADAKVSTEIQVQNDMYQGDQRDTGSNRYVANVSSGSFPIKTISEGPMEDTFPTKETILQPDVKTRRSSTHMALDA